MPGARGRLIANIVYKLANNEPSDIVFTEHNSAHTHIDDWDMQYISDINQTYSKIGKKPVFFTHLYPTWNNKPNIGVIFINVNKDSIEEVCLNAVIKNVIAKIEFLNSGGKFDETQTKFMKVYEQFLPKNYVDILNDKDILRDFLQNIKTEFVPMVTSFYSSFIDNPSLKNTDAFVIDYDKMFDKENGKYIVLKQLTTWMKVEYDNDIHKIYEQYDTEKYNIFEKYCPWLTIQGKL
jgi:hypothetical protein